MSDTPVTLDGSSGPPSDGFVAPSIPKKPWRAPLVITSSEASGATKLPYSRDTTVSTYLGQIVVAGS